MSKLFCGPEGTEMNIYISINGVVDRPRVCRRIKSNGGRICNDALKSDIILVEPSTGDGQEMVHFRGRDQPVLGYRWVEACIREEKFLGAEENWGGYRMHDSGEPPELRGGEDEDEDEEPDVDMHSGPRNILPTPRHTPTSPAVLQPPPSQPSYQSPPLPFSTPAPSNIPTMQPIPAMYASTPFPQATQPIDPQSMTQMFQAFMMAAMSQGYAAPSPTFASGSMTAAPPPTQRPWKGKARATQPEALNPIFKENGKPLTFFVQVDLKNRISVISNIKKYGGKIINNNCDADYAVLHAGSKMFPQLLSGTTDAGRPAVKAAFITDSIASGELEDASAYQFDVPLKHKKRASTSTIGTPRPKRKGSNLVKVEQADVTPSLQPQIGIRSAAKKRKTSTPTLSPARGTPSPTPPPESSRVEMAPGMYRYTEDEQAFMFRYFEYLVQFDGTTTTALTAKRLYERMPHHTIKSWSEYLRSHRIELEAIRKRIGIAKRKAHRLPSSQRESPSPPPTSPNTKTPYDTDMDHFCTFFALGHGDNLEDEMVWDKLDKLHKCQTEPSWAAFNDRHNKVIFERVKEMTRSSG
ncbi:hypothetical protein BDN71DRAFT_1446570 [Pleurotus eryngii]|uniref:BRCT domain-containing protein n=1 Tax=Pleurotus eryngii TaxID=5323 RepID=A0A9P6A2N1_PLEER|nr:hypothetical protein BDN71DRAFT_1446570 [Pleurotus eryngii]